MLQAVKKRKCSKFVEEFYVSRIEREEVYLLEKTAKMPHEIDKSVLFFLLFIGQMSVFEKNGDFISISTLLIIK